MGASEQSGIINLGSQAGTSGTVLVSPCSTHSYRTNLSFIIVSFLTLSLGDLMTREAFSCLLTSTDQLPDLALTFWLAKQILVLWQTKSLLSARIVGTWILSRECLIIRVNRHLLRRKQSFWKLRLHWIFRSSLLGSGMELNPNYRHIHNLTQPTVWYGIHLCYLEPWSWQLVCGRAI